MGHRNLLATSFLLFSIRIMSVKCTKYNTQIEIRVTKSTNKYNFPKICLKEKNSSYSRFLNHILGNLSACFQIYGPFIRSHTACFEKSGFYFAGSYCTHENATKTGAIV